MYVCICMYAKQKHTPIAPAICQKSHHASHKLQKKIKQMS